MSGNYESGDSTSMNQCDQLIIKLLVVGYVVLVGVAYLCMV